MAARGDAINNSFTVITPGWRVAGYGAMLAGCGGCLNVTEGDGLKNRKREKHVEEKY